MSVTASLDKGQGRFKFRTKGRERTFQLPSISVRKSSARRKELNKNRIYLKTPADWYNYQPDEPRDVTSSYQREGTSPRGWSLNDSQSKRQPVGRKIVYDNRMFHNGATKRTHPRKGMIIGERPSLWRVSQIRRPELPGNLFVDNLRQQNVDWRQFNKVTWNDILESHMKDVDRHKVYTQTLPQKEQWLATIDGRVRNSKMNANRDLPHVSQRLFNNRPSPSKAPLSTKYISKDKQGNVFYIVGPGDVTRRDLRPFVLPEITKAPPTPKKLDF